jgi:vancomycin aglycone glucosyltransferase
MRVSQRIAIEAIAAARAVGRRVVLARGRAGLSAIEGAADCLTIGDVNQQMLFPRVAVVVHHGGAGTTTAAARAGAPQVIVPQMYDQHYWAGRVERLGIGVAHAAGVPSAASLADALQCALDFSTAKRARSIATTVRHDGARRAAEYVTSRA